MSAISLLTSALNLQPVTPDDSNIDFAQMIDDNKEDIENNNVPGPSGINTKRKKTLLCLKETKLIVGRDHRKTSQLPLVQQF